MGLLYLFPDSLEDKDHIDIVIDESEQKSITLRSYGLPILFWVFQALILGVIFIMYLLIRSPLKTLIDTQDPLNILIGQAVYAKLFLTAFVPLSFFFFTKKITKKRHSLILTYEIFWIPVRRKKLQLSTNGTENESVFLIRHLMESPNIARMNKNYMSTDNNIDDDKKEERNLDQYMNKGYFELIAKLENNKTILIDRNSRKSDLIKLKNILEQF